MKHRWVYALILATAAVVLAGVIVFKGLLLPQMIRSAISKQGAPPQTVSTMKAGYQDWQPELRAVGNLRAVNGADLSAEVDGIVDSIEFHSGDEVQQGAVLVRLRAGDDAAKLRALDAEADLARIVAERDRRQLQAKAISQATLDADEAALRNAKALADQQRAIVEKKVIRAPFAGRVGLRKIDLGQYLAAGTTVVTLQQVDPIYFDFGVPQQALGRVRPGAPVTVRVDAFPDQSFAGEIVASDPKIDLATRNAQVRASLRNPDRKLLPGMYGSISTETGTPQRLLTLPQAALNFSTFGDTVYVVDTATDASGSPQTIARQTFVTTGATRGDQIAVLNGIKEGDIVVTAGQIKLHNGSAVLINNSLQPSNDPDPRPTEK
jgi:membrane fusion protein (multidrug efflux system)